MTQLFLKSNQLHKALLLVLILSSLLYVELSIGRLFGESQFYSFTEHFVFVLYGLSSFFCCVWIAKKLIHESRPFNWPLTFKYVLFSGLLNALSTSIIFMGVRFAITLNDHSMSWLPPITGLVMNVFYTFLTIHLIIAALYLSYLTIHHSHELKLKQKEAEKHSIEAKLQLLQQQLTPHFLFNNLSILASLIPIEPTLAEKYVTKFAYLYRFVLQNKDEEVVKLTEEINFIEQYLELMSIRFPNAYILQVTFSSEEVVENWVVPGGLQLCVENAVKHNVATSDSPLTIHIEKNGNRLVISNNIARKSHRIPSTNTGLKNLKSRYQLLSDLPVIVKEENSIFSVSIPLIKLSKKD